jgi:XTP/dITP diphosphohydrolase
MTQAHQNSPSPPVFELVIASSNMHKIREFRTLLKPLRRLDLLSLADFPEYLPPEETGKTFEENAILKAVTAAKALNRWTIADDSGLVVPALHGAPGIFSARYAGNQASDFDNRKKLLDDMRHLMDEDRHAFYECVIAVASPSGIKKCVQATCEGELLSRERGTSGFGYDSLFVKHGYNKTFAELTEATKNQISHRAKALNKIFLSLESLLSHE